MTKIFINIQRVLKAMEPINQLIQERLNKLDKISKIQDPFPHNFEKSKHSITKIKENHQNLKPQTHTGKKYNVAGRIILLRNMGKVVFITIKDELESIQLFIKKDETKNFELVKLLDIGDFVGAEGEAFTTKVGELSIYTAKLHFLSKSIRPLPDKHKGLQDVELRYRKRYLDLLVNSSTQQTFIKRTQILNAVREYLNKQGFLEVETPILHPVYGGANARPFKTYHNELKQDLFLRISPELYLKRLIIGGLSKVYDINKNFRNEGIDTTHNPEFTMLEAYKTYADYNDMMDLFEKIFEYTAIKANGSTKVKYQGQSLDFKAPWPRVTMLDSIKQHAKIDASKMSEKQLLEHVKKNKIKFDKQESWGNLVQAIFEHHCEEKIIQPTFIIDHPKETTPLCKLHREDNRLIERFEPFCMGMELGNAYSELNDPLLQKKLLEEQAKELKKGDLEANPFDADFIEAMEYGMPPTGGIGLGIDRMVMLLLDQNSIRDVILFPTLKNTK